MSLFNIFSRPSVQQQSHDDAGQTRLVPATPVSVSDLRAAQFARLSFLSHDLRSPVASILALLDSIDQDGLKAEQLLTLARIEQYAERSLHLSEQLVQLLRVESLPQIVRTELDLLTLAEEVLEQCQGSAKTAGVSLNLQTSSDEMWISVQGELLQRALVNLIDNAIRYSRKGGVVTLRLATQDGHVTCAVEDQGIGIAASDQALLFQHYGKLKQAPPELAGAGIGLHLVKAIAERHGGAVTVTSELGKGSCFVLSLPQG